MKLIKYEKDGYARRLTLLGIKFNWKNKEKISNNDIQNNFPEYTNNSWKNNSFINNTALKNIDKKDISISKVNRISIELSHICNYSSIHKKCPLNKCNKKQILDSDIIYKLFDELKSINYTGIIAFHRYNEPLIDPRLFLFIKYLEQNLPQCHILILSNGFYFTNTILKDLEKFNIDISVTISAYSKKEYERLIALKTELPYKVFFSILDNREDIYTTEPKSCKNPCYAPLNEIILSANGEIGLCCLDWKDSYTFGNLKNSSLQEVISTEKFQDCFQLLSSGKRILPICKNCDWSR